MCFRRPQRRAKDFDREPADILMHSAGGASRQLAERNKQWECAARLTSSTPRGRPVSAGRPANYNFRTLSPTFCFVKHTPSPSFYFATSRGSMRILPREAGPRIVGEQTEYITSNTPVREFLQHGLARSMAVHAGSTRIEAQSTASYFCGNHLRRSFACFHA